MVMLFSFYSDISTMELLNKTERYRVYKIGEPELPENSFILCSDAAAGILYRPHMAGKELQDRMTEVAYDLLDALYPLVLKGKNLQDITELIFLAGGLYYQMNEGFKKRFNHAVPQCFLGIKRQRVEGTEGEFTAVATYENFESLPKNATVIIGDTIATGATLEKGLYHLFSAAQLSGLKIENLIVFSLACSLDGAKKMKTIEEKMKRDFPGSKVYFVACEELFHLMPDGTDLRFLYDDAVMPDETRERTLEKFGEKLGKEMKCAVFDWGTRCKNPIKHYNEFLEFAEKALEKETDEKAKTILSEMKEETLRKLKEFGTPL